MVNETKEVGIPLSTETQNAIERLKYKIGKSGYLDVGVAYEDHALYGKIEGALKIQTDIVLGLYGKYQVGNGLTIGTKISFTF